MPTPKQAALLKAVRKREIFEAKSYLQTGVNPNFADGADMSPLRQAIINNDLTMVRALVRLGGADVNFRTGNAPFPRALAESLDRKSIADYLASKGAVTRAEDLPGSSGLPQSVEKSLGEEGSARLNNALNRTPEFTRDNLKDIFNPQHWVGRTDKMEKLWRKVPKDLQREFNFSGALNAARRATLQRNRPRPKKP